MLDVMGDTNAGLTTPDEPAEVPSIDTGSEPTVDVVSGEFGNERLDWRHPSTSAVVVLLLLVVAVRIGMTPLHDNSFLTHLATGRFIFHHGVPSTDPYSWTAHGDPWTVQSWGASVIYAGLEKAFGLLGIRLFDTVLTCTLVLLLWRMTRRTKGLLARAIPVGIVTCMGTSLWVERPLLIGAVALVLVMMAGEGELDPRWLVPVMWIWVNTHGSFVFGGGLLVLLVVGRWIDDRARPTVELRALKWAIIGTLVGALNPVGPKLLIFPLRLLSKREAFDRVAEWAPTHFHRGVEQFFGVQLLIVLVLVVLRMRKPGSKLPSMRALLPIVVFGAMAITSNRNILQASIVFTPIIAAAASGLGSIDGRRRPRLVRPVALALALLVVLVGLIGVGDRDVALEGYPVKSAQWMRDHHLMGTGDRVMARDLVGNYLEYAYGPDEVRVFIDDRVDMYPLPVIQDFTSLLDPGTDFQAVLDRYHPTAILWNRNSQLGRWLPTSTNWTIVHKDAKWLVAVPRT